MYHEPFPSRQCDNMVDSLYMDDSYLKEFCQHKEKDGEKIEDWAFRSVLYKEAVGNIEPLNLIKSAFSKLVL